MTDLKNLPQVAPEISLEELFEAGVHYGHQSKKWHPKMAEWVYAEKDGVHIFDLEKTAAQLQKAPVPSAWLRATLQTESLDPKTHAQIRFGPVAAPDARASGTNTPRPTENAAKDRGLLLPKTRPAGPGYPLPRSGCSLLPRL